MVGTDTTESLVADFRLWRSGADAAEHFYATHPSLDAEGKPQDYDWTPHMEAQERVMRRPPTDGITALIVLEAMADWADDGGHIPVSGLRNLQAWVSASLLSEFAGRIARSDVVDLLRNVDACPRIKASATG